LFYFPPSFAIAVISRNLAKWFPFPGGTTILLFLLFASPGVIAGVAGVIGVIGTETCAIEEVVMWDFISWEGEVCWGSLSFTSEDLMFGSFATEAGEPSFGVNLFPIASLGEFFVESFFFPPPRNLIGPFCDVEWFDVTLPERWWSGGEWLDSILIEFVKLDSVVLEWEEFREWTGSIGFIIPFVKLKDESGGVFTFLFLI